MFKFGYHSIQSMEGVSHKSTLAENAGLQSREFLARVQRKGFMLISLFEGKGAGVF